MKRCYVAYLLAGILAACSPAVAPVQDELERSGSALDWPLHGRDWKEQRFSPLADINSTNVQELGLAWEFDAFAVRGRTHRGVEASPLIQDGKMYLSGPWSVVYALDAETGDELWFYDPDVEGAWARKACCDAVNRGVALSGGHVIVGTLDGYLDAVDAESGQRIWRTDTLIDRERAYTITGAPRLAGDLVLIGNGGAELGVRGYVSAYRIDTGELAWRFYTVPGAGPGESDAIERARETWGPDTRWEFGGGGTVWDSMTYDPELNLVYIGVGNGSPWPKWNRDPSEGDNLYLSSIVALEATTGEYVWHYQTTPGDSWDYTATQNILLAELELDGVQRNVLMQAPKNGYFYIIDRETGELLSAEPYTHVTWSDGVDMETGRPILSETSQYNNEAKVIWPGTPGGHNWQPMAFSPETGFVYIPVLEMPQKFALGSDPEFRADTMNVAADVKAPPFPKDDPAIGAGHPEPAMRAVLKAWDPVAGKVAWESEEMSWWNGGVLATAGNLVIQGGSEGYLRFYDATTGEKLGEIFTGTGIMAPPSSYQLGETQYLAVPAGYGGAQLGRLFPGMAALAHENSERLLVYRLGGGETPLPPKKDMDTEYPVLEGVSEDPADIAAGLSHYKAYCGRCHAPMGAPNGYPDLWNLSPASHQAFVSTVLGGTFEYAGMAGFSDALDEADVEQIRAFIVSTQKKIRDSKQEQD
jgi:quinohemoprotein ethanol dehydrogenase